MLQLLHQTYRPASRLRFIHTDVKTSLEIRGQLFNVLAIIAGQAVLGKRERHVLVSGQQRLSQAIGIHRVPILLYPLYG